MKLNFESQFITDIMSEFNNIQKMLVETGNTFVILTSEESYSSISCELGELVNILKVSDFEPKEASLGFNGKLIQFSLPCPQYVIKNGVIVSEYAASLKKMYAARFDNLIISESCHEGKKLYDNVKIKCN